MSEGTLESLHPLHFVEQEAYRMARLHNLHGSFYLNLPHISRSPELSRAYQIGDPVRLIDWKAYARNDQLIVREERDEAMAKVVIVLDGRDSMHWPDISVEKEIGQNLMKKFSLAVRMALHLVYRHVRAGDKVRLVLLEENFQEDDVLSIDLRTPAHVLSLFQELEEKNFSKDVLKSFLSPNILFFPRTNVCFWISDGCSGTLPSTYFEKLQHSVFFHVLSSLECELSWIHERICYYDEYILKKEFLGNLLKKNFQSRLTEWMKKVQKDIELSGAIYLRFTEKTSLKSYVISLDSLSQI